MGKMRSDKTPNFRFFVETKTSKIQVGREGGQETEKEGGTEKAFLST